jgi:hypothetical protein
VIQIVAGALLIAIGLALIGFVTAKTQDSGDRVISLVVPLVGLMGAAALLAGIGLLLTWLGAAQASHGANRPVADGLRADFHRLAARPKSKHGAPRGLSNSTVPWGHSVLGGALGRTRQRL